jgi:signal transduction histidine kinase
MRPALRQRRLTLAIKEVDPGLLTYADAGRLWQAFNNILENAIKFTPDGGRVTVGTRLLPGFIEITIADTGIGIALEHQERIFEKFGSVGNIALHSTGKTKFKGGGPGLGLPIARGIIEAHGGKIWVVSPGHDERACPGSTFHIMLPHLDAAPPDKTLKLFDPFPQIQAVIQRKHDDTRPHSAPPS